ncbi:hypothetical protein Bca4012_043203 [Brassica carinata]
MAMVTSGRINLLKNVKPFKTTWIVEVKVLHSWSQPSNYAGGDSLQFILADRTGVKIHCTCKRVFFPRVKKLQVGQWRFIENFSVTPAGGKYRATSHKYKLSIIGSSLVTSSSLKIDEISLLSNENEDGTCSASTPLSKRSGDNQIDDLASTTKKHCSKAIKMEKKIKVEKIEGE